MSTIELEPLHWDLIADEVLDELDAAGQNELERVDGIARARAREELEGVAASLAMAFVESRGGDAMPPGLSARILERYRVEMAERGRTEERGEQQRAGTSDRVNASGRWTVMRVLPWCVAAAACIALGAALWPAVLGRGGAPNPRSTYAALQSAGAKLARWSDWSLEGQPPKVAGVAGEIVWSDAEQAGVAHFNGLPKCGPGERYQLWIVDAERGFDQRVNGGIFDGGQEDVYVPVSPSIRVRKAAAFAVTIEASDGTWVSDMSRRVVIATIQ